MIKDLSSSILSITTITEGFSSSVLLLNCDGKKLVSFTYNVLTTGVRAETLCVEYSTSSFSPGG